MRRTARAVHRENPAGLKTCLFRQGENPPAQLAFFQRFELVEQRRDQARIEHNHEKLKREDKQKSPEPPVGTGRVHQPKNDEKKRDTDREREQEPFELIDDVKPGRGLVEAETLFEDERRIDVGGKAQERKNDPDTETKNN